MEPEVDLPALDLEPTDDLLGRDAGNVRRVQRWTEERSGEPDDGRVLVVLPAGAGSQPLLNGALPKLLEGVHASRRKIDLLLGLNDGIAPPEILERIEAEGARIVQLWTAPKRTADDPAPVFADPASALADSRRADRPCTLADRRGDPGRSTVYVVHQAKSPYSAGVVRILLDLYALAVRSAGAGWPLPAKTLKCDAESYIVRSADDDHSPLDLDAPGFGLLADALDADPRLSFVGSRVRQVAFRELDRGLPLALPDWSERIPAIHLYNNIINGTEGYEVLQGPAILGLSSCHLAVGYVATRTCTEGIADDYLMQVLANAAGLRHRVVPECVTTNRVPPASDGKAFEQQLVRWFSGADRVRERYRVAQSDPSWPQIARAIRRCRRSPQTDLRLFFQAASQWIRAARAARRQPAPTAWERAPEARISSR